MNLQDNHNLWKLAALVTANAIVYSLTIVGIGKIGESIGKATIEAGWSEDSKTNHIAHSKRISMRVYLLLSYSALTCYALFVKEHYFALTPVFALSNYTLKCGFKSPVTDENTLLAKFEKGFDHLIMGALCGMIPGLALSMAKSYHRG